MGTTVQWYSDEGRPLAENAKPKIAVLEPRIRHHAAFMREAGEYLLVNDAGVPIASSFTPQPVGWPGID